MSHSQVLEWISGSFIQSHWPWVMLWPSSMFSMHLRHEQGHGSGSPSGLASAAEDGQPGGDFQAPLKSDDALDVCAVLCAQRRFDVAADLVQREPERFDVRVAQVRVLSYFCDRNGASHPNQVVGGAPREKAAPGSSSWT